MTAPNETSLEVITLNLGLWNDKVIFYASFYLLTTQKRFKLKSTG